MKHTFIFLGALFFFVGALTASFAQDFGDPPNGIKHVVWIGSDGFGAHYVNWDKLPNLKMMKENGAWTLHMRSVFPSSSALNWESRLTGAPSESHGYRTWGSKEPDVPPIYLTENGRFPDSFYVLKKKNPDFKTSIVFSWEGIGYLYDKSAVDSEVFIPDNRDDLVLETAKKQLAEKPDFAFIYFHDPDCTSHRIGWGTPEYQATLTRIDGYVGGILKYLKEIGMADDTVVVFSSDHGGTDKGHGDLLLSHMEVPFLLYGKGVKPGEITDVVVNYDLAATVVWLLGAKQPQAWRGRPVRSAF